MMPGAMRLAAACCGKAIRLSAGGRSALDHGFACYVSIYRETGNRETGNRETGNHETGNRETGSF